MVQDYRYINGWIIKNNYSLSFIDLIDIVSTKKVFFIILEWFYEPRIIFFRLTNSLATFQIIINNILRYLVLCHMQVHISGNYISVVISLS